MFIEIPLKITYLRKKDEKCAEFMIVMIHKTLSKPEYVKKINKIINEAHVEVVKHIKETL